jgi:hypothetical protein
MTKAPTRNTAGAKAGVAKPALNADEVKRFGKAAKTFTGKATVSRHAARQALIGLGISTQSGKLTKRYR